MSPPIFYTLKSSLFSSGLAYYSELLEEANMIESVRQ